MHLMPFLPLFCMGHKDWCFDHNAEIRSTKEEEMSFSCFELEWGMEEKCSNVLTVYLYTSKEIIFPL